MGGFVHDVFVSYASADRHRDPPVERVVRVLGEALTRRLGRQPRIFFDQAEIKPGDVWPDRLRDAAASSSVMVACLSPAYFESDWCHREWSAFVTRERATGRRLIYPLRLHLLDPAVEPAPSKRSWFEQAQQLQTTDAKGLLGGETLDRFVDALHASIDGTGKAASTTARASGSVALRWGNDPAAFVKAMSEASKVTIVGVTLDRLVGLLEQAMRRRQSAGADPWQQLRVVALDEGLLSLLHDERMANSAKARRERKLAANQRRNELIHWLENESRARNWSLHSYRHMLPFVGALFEYAGGQRVAQVAHLAPGRAAPERLYLEFDSFLLTKEVSYYEASFESIVRASEIIDEVIVALQPIDGRYEVQQTVRRGETFKGRSRGSLLAVVVALLWFRDAQGRARPLLQVRTSRNSRRELDTLSNLTGYVNVADLPTGKPARKGLGEMTEAAWLNAAQREIREELNLAETWWHTPKPVADVRYYYADPSREGFVFRIFTVEMTLSLNDLQHRIAAKVELGSWSVPELCAIRQRQALAAARRALSQPLSPAMLEAALKVVVLNLRLHGERELLSLAEAPSRAAGWQETFVQTLDARLQAIAPATHRSWRSDVTIDGFAGMQYREFFSKLLPAYAEIGVEGARETLCAPGVEAAARELSALYADLAFVRALPTVLE